MGNSKVEFFKPLHVVGTLADWELQTGGNPTITRQRDQTLGENGDQHNAVQFGAQIAYTENFKAKRVTGNALVVPLPGKILEGAHVDSITVSYTQNTAPTLAVASHCHAAIDGTPQAHDPCRVYSPSVILPARAIGVPSALKFKKGAAKTETDVFKLPAGIGMRSLSYALQPTHIDEPDGDGGHLAGQNHDGVETLTIEFTGKVDVSDLQIDGEWMLPDNDADSMGNTQATTKSITITHHIAFDTTQTPENGDK